MNPKRRIIPDEDNLSPFPDDELLGGVDAGRRLPRAEPYSI
jgi:hypothetical protein